MTSISRSAHEKMQDLLRRLETEAADKMRQDLEASHDRFMHQLAAARESVMLYEKQYKSARLLLAKAAKEQKKAESAGVVK
jgi:ClpP class serine protease